MQVPAEPPPCAGVWSLPGAQVKHALESDATLHVTHEASQVPVRESSRYWQSYLAIARAFKDIPATCLFTIIKSLLRKVVLFQNAAKIYD